MNNNLGYKEPQFRREKMRICHAIHFPKGFELHDKPISL